MSLIVFGVGISLGYLIGGAIHARRSAVVVVEPAHVEHEFDVEQRDIEHEQHDDVHQCDCRDSDCRDACRCANRCDSRCPERQCSAAKNVNVPMQNLAPVQPLTPGYPVTPM
jgi:hypothetical protein